MENATLRAPGAGRPPRSALARGVAAVFRRPLTAVGGILLALILLIALLGPIFTPYNPLDLDPASQWQAPSGTHLFGTDEYGRDIFSRVIAATRLDILVAVSITLLALLVGTLIGAVAGFYGGRFDDVIMRVVDILMAFPSFILAMGVTAMLGNNVRNVIIAVAVASTPVFIRLVRSQMLSVRELEYAQAARTVGNPGWRIMLVHLLPNCITPALAQSTLSLGWSILNVAGLAFLGLGIRPPTAEWGVMVSEGSGHIFSGQWWASFYPGLAIVLTVLAFNLLGDGLVSDRDGLEVGR